MTTQPEEQVQELTVGYKLRPMEADERIIRQIMLGGNPLVLIESDMSADAPTFDIDATGFDDLEELAVFLEGMAEATRGAMAHYEATQSESKES